MASCSPLQPTDGIGFFRTSNQSAESGSITCHSSRDYMGAFVNTPRLKKIGHEGIAAFCDCPLPRPPERHIQQPQVAGGLHVYC